MAGIDFQRMMENADWFRQGWGRMGGVPPSMVPTLDPVELERRIAELRTVEQWLSVNLEMLRGSIQAMEVQRHTLVAMRALGEAAQKQAAGMPDILAAAARAFGTPPGVAAPAAASVPPTEIHAMQGGLEAADIAAMSEDGAAAGSLPPGFDPKVMLDPSAWWSLLQQQFGQVAGAALAGMEGARPASQAPADAAEPATAPAPAKPSRETAADATPPAPAPRGRRR